MTRSKQELERNSRFNVRPKGVFLAKNAIYPKKKQNFLRDLYLFWKRVLFSLQNLFRSRPEHGVQKEMYVFLGPKFWFLPYNPNSGQRPVCRPQRDGSFSTFGRFFDLSFPSYGRFHKKEHGLRVKKSSPSPLWGNYLPVTAVALSASGQLLWNTLYLVIKSY